MEQQQLADGYYRVEDEGGEERFIAHVCGGVIGDDNVEWYLEQGYDFEPMVVMTPAEYAAALQAEIARLPAQQPWEPVPDGKVLPEKFGGDFEISGNGSELVMASEGTVIWADLPDNYRLCRRK